jgi:hypothetical protein
MRRDINKGLDGEDSLDKIEEDIEDVDEGSNMGSGMKNSSQNSMNLNS